MTNDNISFHNIKQQYLKLKPELEEAISKVCSETAFAGGKYVEIFESDFAKHYNLGHVAGVNSGTSALFLALIALDIKPGDEVILPANTFIATAWAIAYVNARPVFVDCQPDTWEIDPQDVEKKITNRTKAIIGVHLYGQTFDLAAIMKIAKKHQLKLVEDCAQAHGATYKGQVVGSYGAMGCYSFYPGKNLGALGEAGAVVSQDNNYINRIKKLRNHGSTIRYHHDELGYNMRMDGLQAACLSVKLKHIEVWTKRRKNIAQQYISGIKNSKIKLQAKPEWADSVYHLFVITTDKRKDFIDYLSKQNIGTALHYPIPCHLQKAFTSLGYNQGDLPNAEYLAEHCVSLPMYPELTDAEVERVIKTINNY